MASFTQNINTVAGLDERYGKALTLSKSNVALGAISYQAAVKLVRYDITEMMEVETLLTTTLDNDVTATTLGDYVDELVAELVALGLTANGSVGTNGTMQTMDISVTDTNLLVGLEIKMTNGAYTKYTIESTIGNPIKIMPLLSTLGTEFTDGIKSTKEHITEITTVAGELGVDKAVTKVSTNIQDVVDIANNLANINKTASITDMQITINQVAHDVAATVDYTYEEGVTNEMVLNVPAGTPGLDAVAIEYEMTYDDTTGILAWEPK